MRRPTVGVLLLLWVSPLLLAMGGGGAGPSSDTIPRPKENYAADLIDKQGVTTRVTLLSCNGKTFFPLERGEGTLMVPFSLVSRVKIGAEKGTQVEVTIGAVGGKALEGTLSRNLLCTGVTDYGNYQIEIRGVKQISFTKQ